MNMNLPLFPAIAVDMAGSSLMLVFAILSTRYAWLLSRKQPDNFLWGYLFYVTFAISAFAISRAVGHLVKQFLLLGNRNDLWHTIAPYSGGFNTLFMISVAAIMIFYHKGVQAFEALENEAAKIRTANQSLETAAHQLRDLNQNLELKVEERTAALSQSESKFRHLFYASKDMVFFCDADSRIIEMNQSGMEMLGYNSNEMQGIHLVNLFANPEEIATYSDRLRLDGFIKDLNLEFRKKDGAQIPVLLSAATVAGDEGKIIGSEIIAKDLTSTKNVMEQLATSEKLASIGQIAAGVAHEINTPLGVILGYSQLLMEEFEEGSENHQTLQVIERQTKASRKIVADLLKFSRQTNSLLEEINLNTIIGDVIGLTDHTLQINNIGVHTDLDPDLPPIRGDQEKLRQVIINLINNSQHAMAGMNKGALFVTTRLKTQDTLELEIRDTGHGIPAIHASKIFDPFFTTKPVGEGTGLGLSITYGIIQDHGGSIEVESPVKNAPADQEAGTVFRILLPVKKGARG